MEPEPKNDIEIKVYKGDKLFNKNIPFVINLFAPEAKEEDEQRVNADLICVIDISGSMDGQKIHLVKESLKILVDMMDPKDRIALVLFNQSAKLYYDLDYLSEKNKSHVKTLIDKIQANGGTNIASGLEVAIEILKKQKKNEKNEEERSSSVILLSDGRDNYMDDIQLGEKLKSLTKGEGLSFTLNTFGYGYDHDPKIMNKLATLRDGSFFLVENYNKVGEYFVSVLGGCISMVSKNAKLDVKSINPNCKIMKVFGVNNLYSYEIKDLYFINQMLQFIKGKDYTFVLELAIDESKIKPGDNLVQVTFNYIDIITKEKKKIDFLYEYTLTDMNLDKANEEYIRSQTYEVLEQALKLKEENKENEAKKILKEMREWLEKNYKGENKIYLEDIKKSEKMFENRYEFEQKACSYVTSQVRQMQSKRVGSITNYTNSVQKALQSNYVINFNQSIKNSKP